MCVWFSIGLVKEAGATFQLICNTEAGFEGPINWTHANSEDETDLDHQSHKLEIPDFEDSSAGNYSCWSGDKLLDSVHVFLAATPDSTSEYFWKTRRIRFQFLY